MYKVYSYNKATEVNHYFDSESDAKHWAIDMAYDGFKTVVYDIALPMMPKRLWRSEQFGLCFGVVPC